MVPCTYVLGYHIHPGEIKSQILTHLLQTSGHLGVDEHLRVHTDVHRSTLVPWWDHIASTNTSNFGEQELPN